MKETLLTINHVYLLAGATIYVGVLTTLRLFLMKGWTNLRPETIHDQFTVPIAAATKFFVIAIPTWIFSSIVMIVTEWGEPTVWPSIIAFLGLIIASSTFLAGIKPINAEINAGVSDKARLTELLTKWTKINDVRWAASIVFWGGVCWYFVQRPDLPGALG